MVTPRTTTFLEIHQSSYEKAIRALKSNKSVVTAITKVQTLDEIHSSEAFLFRKPSEGEQARIDAILKLRETQMICNHAGYLSIKLKHFRRQLYSKRLDPKEEEAMKKIRPHFSTDKH